MDSPAKRTMGSTAALLLALGVAVTVTAGSPTDYEAAIKKQRRDLEARLTAEDGWLAVSGLYWLKVGENRFGSDPSNDFALPPGSTPADVGVFEFANGKTTVRVNPGIADAHLPVPAQDPLRHGAVGAPEHQPSGAS